LIPGLDSATEPSAAQAQAAHAVGVRLWSGYLATQANVGLYHAWSRDGFENARLCGGAPIAYCSGWDNPSACAAVAKAWNVRLCLDVEGGIRGKGPWVQGWLDASGAGLYGNAPVHPGRRAAFHVLAGYPGVDPQATWDPRQLAPDGPTGWQWQGTHTEFGVGVDRGWFDDWFASLYGASPGELGEDMTPDQEAKLTEVLAGVRDLNGALFYPPTDPIYGNFAKLFEAKLKANAGAGGGLTPLQAQALVDIHDILVRLDHALAVLKAA